MAEHKIGHLPFEAEVSEQLKFGQENRITVLVGKCGEWMINYQGDYRDDTYAGLLQYTFYLKSI